jgi:hypothetical protein
MSRVLGPDFPVWFDAFLPRLAAGEPATLFTPATVSDRSDGKIAHLDGLNLSRAWCWRDCADDSEVGDRHDRNFRVGNPVENRHDRGFVHVL